MATKNNTAGSLLVSKRNDRRIWRNAPVPVPTINIPTESNDITYWENKDGISPRLSLIEEHMLRYATLHKKFTIHNFSTIGHNCLLESIAIALEDSGTIPYFTGQDKTAQAFFVEGYTSLRNRIADHLKNNALALYSHDRRAGPSLPFIEDYYAETMTQNRTWENYIEDIRQTEFLDLRCITALCYMLGNMTISVLQFRDDHNPPIRYSIGPIPNQNQDNIRHNITIAVRENQHFYAFIRSIEWDVNSSASLPILRTPVVSLKGKHH